ncbi:MAG: hypothetical protein PHU55_00115 [Bacilli bacterium]|nr:hypothetical protein [Bacilli bacterium]
MQIFFRLFLSLLLTLVIEVPIYFVSNRKSLEYLLTVYAMNIVFNILMNILLLFFFSNQYWPALIIMEIFVFLIEGFIIFWFDNIRYKGFLIALGANLASLGMGLLFNLFGLLERYYIVMLILLPLLFAFEFVSFFLIIIKNNKQS